MLPIRDYQLFTPNVLSNFFDKEWSDFGKNTTPSLNVIESSKDYKIELAAPGSTKEDFNLNIEEGNVLVIKMEKKTESKEEAPVEGKKATNKDNTEQVRYLRRDFSYTKFQQSLILPDDANIDKLSATVKNGVLTIDVAKYNENEKPTPSRQIAIN